MTASSELLAKDTARSEQNTDARNNRPLLAMLVLLCLGFAEWVSFGSAALKTGLCVDEWELFGRLNFLPHSLGAYISHIFQHQLFIVRPLEAPFFGLAYYLFGNAPLPYHLLNLGIEVLGAFFLYLALVEITAARAFAFAGALIFLLLPNHQITHFSITTIASTAAMGLFNLSMWRFVAWARRGGFPNLLASYAWAIASLTIYELCVPLLLLLPVSAFCSRQLGGEPLKKSARALCLATLPLFGFVGLFYAYRTILLKQFGYGAVYATSLDPQHILNVFAAGLSCSFFPAGFGTYGAFAWKELHEPVKASAFVLLGLLCTSILAVVIAACKSTRARSFDSRQVVILSGFSLLAVLLGYSVYSIAPAYMPDLDSYMSRVNQAPALGVSIALATALTLAARSAGSNKLLSAFVFGTPLILLSTIFILTNWQFARPWAGCHAMQQSIARIVREKAAQIPRDSCLFLANTPRYVMWAPLFDSVWDFQSAVRIELADQNFKAGVVSERLTFKSKNQLIDSWNGNVISEYDVSKIRVLVPDSQEVVPISSADQFIDLIEKRGMTFGLSSAALKRWRDETR